MCQLCLRPHLSAHLPATPKLALTLPLSGRGPSTSNPALGYFSITSAVAAPPGRARGVPGGAGPVEQMPQVSRTAALPSLALSPAGCAGAGAGSGSASPPSSSSLGRARAGDGRGALPGSRRGGTPQLVHSLPPPLLCFYMNNRPVCASQRTKNH